MGPSGVVFPRDLAKVVEDVNKLTSDNDKGDFMSDNDYFYTLFGFPVPHPLDSPIIPDPIIENGPEGLSVPESDPVPVPGSDPISGSNALKMTISTRSATTMCPTRLTQQSSPTRPEGFVYKLSHRVELPKILADDVREAPMGERFDPELPPRTDPVPGSTALMVTGKVESVWRTKGNWMKRAR